MKTLFFFTGLIFLFLGSTSLRSLAQVTENSLWGEKKNLLSICSNEQVKDELNLKPSQKFDIEVIELEIKQKGFNDELVKARLAGILQPNQLKRLKEITLQLRDGEALREPEVANALNLTSDQRKTISHKWDSFSNKMALSLKKLRFKDKKSRQDYIDKNVEEIGSDFKSLLTPQQRSSFIKLKGKELDQSIKKSQ